MKCQGVARKNFSCAGHLSFFAHACHSLAFLTVRFPCVCPTGGLCHWGTGTRVVDDPRHTTIVGGSDVWCRAGTVVPTEPQGATLGRVSVRSASLSDTGTSFAAGSPVSIGGARAAVFLHWSTCRDAPGRACSRVSNGSAIVRMDATPQTDTCTCERRLLGTNTNTHTDATNRTRNANTNTYHRHPLSRQQCGHECNRLWTASLRSQTGRERVQATCGSLSGCHVAPWRRVSFVWVAVWMSSRPLGISVEVVAPRSQTDACVLALCAR